MKPIKLQFAGLNSYRTQQVVDFETLGADGLFGIFGPTGSGKSSILDAITLALYGGVDRASNNTRGIIQQLEKTLEVAFEFQLGAERYLVERRYGRNPKDPDAAVAKQARLRKLSLNEEDILASKPHEVTVKVEAILGIGKEDFSRAVVLPQGKFDRFLRLTGGDRAAMLEQLFNLEQYGEGLVAKVKNEATICTELFQRIAGEEQGLGDCSQDAVDRAILDLKTKNDALTSAQKSFETLDQSFQEAEAVRELYIKQKTALKKLNQLEGEKETIDQKQSRLNAAERAEPLRELIWRQKDLNTKIGAESVAYQTKLAAHSGAVTQYETAGRESEKAAREYQERLPQLQERKAQYQGAREKQKKLKDLHKHTDEKQREWDLLGGKIATTRREIGATKSLTDAMQLDLERLQQKRSTLIVNPDEKEWLERALTVLMRLEESEKRCQENKDLYTKRKSQNDKRWTILIAKVHAMLPDQAVAAGDDPEKYSKSLLNQAEKALDAARKAQQQALITNAAAELVRELHDGEPCPVCGSREHPLPAQANDELEKIASEIKAAEKRLREVRTWEGQLLKQWHDWSANEPVVNEARQQMEEAEKDLRAALTEFEKARGTYEREQLRSRKQELMDYEKQLHAIDQKRDELQKTRREQTVKLEQMQESSQNDQIKAAAARADLMNFRAQLEDITAELHEITGGKDLNALIRAMTQTYTKLEQAVRDTKAKEAETRDAMEKLTREIAALQATLNANRDELAGIAERLTTGLQDAGFAACAEAETHLLKAAERQIIRRQLEQYRQEAAVARSEADRLEQQINKRPFEAAAYEEMKTEREALFQEVERVKTAAALARNQVEELQKKQARWNELQKQKITAEKRMRLAEDLLGLLRGRRFVSFLAQVHLRDMTLEASYQLGRLTGQRYALELAKDKDCEFVIRDDYNGGARRMIHTLSGGEVFMTSLALALALSSKIQLRGKYPLGFFFLDEGFGSLDGEKLDKVMNALEKLHNPHRMVGVISHVREMKERLPRYLEVVAAGEDGNGSMIKSIG
jgi:exonuclease SbcC